MFPPLNKTKTKPHVCEETYGSSKNRTILVKIFIFLVIFFSLNPNILSRN